MHDLLSDESVPRTCSQANEIDRNQERVILQFTVPRNTTCNKYYSMELFAVSFSKTAGFRRKMTSNWERTSKMMVSDEVVRTKNGVIFPINHKVLKKFNNEV